MRYCSKLMRIDGGSEMVYYSLCWVLSARYLPVAVLRAVISVFNLLFLGSIFIVKYYKIFAAFCRYPNIYSAF
jgi:hypothetical protein